MVCTCWLELCHGEDLCDLNKIISLLCDLNVTYTKGGDVTY